MAASSSSRQTKINFNLLQRYFPTSTINACLEKHHIASQRTRKLSAYFMVYYLVGLCFYPHLSARETLRTLLDGLFVQNGHFLKACQGVIASRAAIAQARIRLGSAVMQDLFTRFARPCATPDTPGAFFKHWRVVAIDGTLMALTDTKANFAHFGGPGKTPGIGSVAAMSLVILVECGTHIIFGASYAPYGIGEVVLARELLSHLRREMLCLCDREYVGYPWWQGLTKTGAAAVVRVRKNLDFTNKETLSDGSYLASMKPSRDLKKTGARSLRVRVIEYRVSNSDEVYHLITNILDPKVASAAELADLYHERWEIELALREVKSELRGGSLAVMRSKTPELVVQELYNMLLAHYVVRRLMLESAEQANEDSDHISFRHSLSLIRRRLPQWIGTCSAAKNRAWMQGIINEILDEMVSSSRNMHVERGVRRHSKYHVRPQGPTTPRKCDWVVSIILAA